MALPTRAREADQRSARARARDSLRIMLTQLVVRVVEDGDVPREAVEVDRAAPNGNFGGLDAGRGHDDDG